LFHIRCKDARIGVQTTSISGVELVNRIP
jgi:hypothetical protein